MRVVLYGLGGHDETKPNNNIIEEYEVPDIELYVSQESNIGE